MSLEIALFEIAALTTAIMTIALLKVLEESAHLRKKFMKQGHYCILWFGIIDLAHASTSWDLIQLTDNVLLAFIYVLTIPFYGKGIKYQRPLFKVAHLLMPIWMVTYITVTPFDSWLSWISASLITSGVVLICIGFYFIVKEHEQKFLLLKYKKR